MTADRSYTDEAREFDLFLDEKIAAIRQRQDAGEISTRQAADERVEALAHHLAVVKALRAEFWPEHGDDE